ncbi:hypothetical protein [Glutamicibacter creatinolyticus]|uniref:hypothetical protein n=1 Tax=Glutamicibacter creatinolyticus TaxID=162496 RepID=UPI0032178E0A
MACLLLLSSIFLQPSALLPLAEQLTGRGHQVEVQGADPGEGAKEALEQYSAALDGLRLKVEAEPVLVIAHSNAGAYLPSLLDRFPGTRAIFLDAILPPFDGRSLALVPATLGEPLRGRAEAGLLPRWSRWWPRASVRALVDSDADFAQLDEHCPRVAASYVDERLPVPAGWSAQAAAGYLLLSDGYLGDWERAVGSGWPAQRLQLGHLGFLRDPGQVALALDHLSERLTGRDDTGGGVQ